MQIRFRMRVLASYPTTHDCTKNELMMAVSTVMMNWMMVFQVFRSFRNFIKSNLVFVLVSLDNIWSFVS